MKTKLSFIVVFTILISRMGFAIEPPSEPILRLTTGMHTADIGRLDCDSRGKLVLSSSEDKTARLWDGETGELIRIFRPPIDHGKAGDLYACALSPEGSVAVIGGWTIDHSFYLFNTFTGKMIRRISGQRNVIFDFEFSSDGRYLAASVGGQREINIFDTSSWKLTAKLVGGGDSDNVSFDQDGRLAVISDDGKLRLYDIGFQLLEEIETTGGKEPTSVSFAPDGGKIAVGYYDSNRIQVFDGSDLSLLFEPNTSGVNDGERLDIVSLSNTKLYAGGTYEIHEEGRRRCPIRVWGQQGRGSYTDFPVAADFITDIKLLPDDSLVFSSDNPDFGRIDSEGNISFYRSAETFNFHTTDRDHFGVSSDGMSVEIIPHAEVALTFVIEERQLIRKKSNLPLAQTQRHGVTLSDWKDSFAPKLNGKVLTLLSRYEKCQSAAISSDAKSVVIGSDWSLYCLEAAGMLRWRQAAPGAVWAVNIADDAGLCVAAYGDGTIRWHKLSDGKEILALFMHADGKRWVIWTPSGYYDCSPGGQELIGWHVNNGNDSAADFFSAGRFSDRYYRPDIIPLVLKYRDEGAAIEKAEKRQNDKLPAKSIRTSLPPVISIIKPKYGEVVTEDKVLLKIEVRTPSDDPILEMKTLVNGRPTGLSSRGFGIYSKAKETDTLSVPLQRGDNIISVIARNRGGWSEPASVKVAYKTSIRFVIQPKLYILAIGVADYKDKDLALKFPAKDAQDFSRVMTAQKGKLYRDVTLKILTNSSATKNNILDGLDWIQRETTAKDIAMIFLAGHGVNDNTGRLYYLPVDADTERLRRSSIPVYEVTDVIRNIAGKIIYFMDTCHSGNIQVSRRGPELDLTKVVNELSSAENGAIVFCSSSGRQYSLESDEWKNGAFTKALVDGLNGEADFTKDGKLTINELDLYIAETVKALTNGKQTPVTAKPVTIRDFPIAVIP